MKANIINKAVCVVALTFAAMTLGSCTSTNKVVNTNTKNVERSTVLEDQGKPLTAWISCEACDGKGSCVRCKGTGKVSGKKCVSCNGTGKCPVCGGKGGYRSEK